MPFTPPPQKKLMIISYTVPEINCVKDISLIIIILGYFLPFYPTNRLKNKNEKKMEKNPWRLIILHKCTKNHDYMLYCSWDMACDRCNCCFSFWAISCPFTPLTAQKRFQKNEKNSWRNHHFTHLYQRIIIGYSVLEICDGCNYFSFWAIFCLFTPLTARKMKIFLKMKKNPGDIIILHKCTRNHDHMLHCSLYMARDTCNFYFSFWAFFALLPPTSQKKSKEWKKHLEISPFYTCIPKIIIRWCMVPEISGTPDGQTDGHTNGKSDISR